MQGPPAAGRAARPAPGQPRRRAPGRRRAAAGGARAASGDGGKRRGAGENGRGSTARSARQAHSRGGGLLGREGARGVPARRGAAPCPWGKAPRAAPRACGARPRVGEAKTWLLLLAFMHEARTRARTHEGGAAAAGAEMGDGGGLGFRETQGALKTPQWGGPSGPAADAARAARASRACGTRRGERRRREEPQRAPRRAAARGAGAAQNCAARGPTG
jgi:hypothetical protein